MNMPSLHPQPSQFSRSSWASAQSQSVDFSYASESTAPHGKASARAAVWQESLALVQQHVPFGRRWYQAGDEIFGCGQAFGTVYLVGSGLCKEVNLAADGREQTADLHFRGDWLGFDGIPSGRYHCSTVALERSEVWSVDYPDLLKAASREASLMRGMLAAMSTQMIRSRDALLSMGTLNAEARVGGFLLQWATALQERGQCTDLINVYMTRAEIGNHLGMRVESVSRALSKIAQSGAIEFNAPTRREISIPNLGALRLFVQGMPDAEKTALH